MIGQKDKPATGTDLAPKALLAGLQIARGRWGTLRLRRRAGLVNIVAWK